MLNSWITDNIEELKKISKELQEEISDEELKEMIIEANPELRPLYNE